MKRERGNIYFILIGTIAVLAMLGAAANWLVNKGEQNKQAEWDESNRAIEAFAKGRRLYNERLARAASAELARATTAAADYYDQLKIEKSKRRQNGTPLYVSVDCSPAALGDEPKLPPGVAPRLRLTYQFLREWDAGWTGDTGQPVFSDTGGPADGPLGAASPLTLDDALDNQGTNAQRCSADRRQLKKLVTLVRKLRADWGRTLPP